jgi:uncharacterized protein (DUF433 family)
MVAVSKTLGIGIYSPAEAAFYARVSTRMMSRWVFGDAQGKAVIDREFLDPSEKIVTFLDFIQTLAVREVRNRHKIPLQRIRAGIEAAREEYKIDYPLACRHTIFLFSDQKGEGHGEIVIRLPDEDGQYVQLTGKAKGNRMMQSVVEMFLDDLQFDPVTKLATQYSPMAEGDASVVLDPHIRFGEPVIMPRGYTAEALWHATNTEGGIDAAAEAYGVTVQEVILANKYFDALLADRAA